MDDAPPGRMDPLDPGEIDRSLSDERVAVNEVTARRVNEAIEEGVVHRDGTTGFICECGQLGCNTVIELTLREYEQVRSAARQFVLVADHHARLDRVVERHPTHAIVVKQGIAGRIAAATDPRDPV